MVRLVEAQGQFGYAKLPRRSPSANARGPCAGRSPRRSGSWPSTGDQLLALVDTLHDGTLNEDQRETVHALRLVILALAEKECAAI